MNIAKKMSKVILLIGVVVFLFVNISLLVHYGDISYRGNVRIEFNNILLFLLSAVLLAMLVFAARALKRIHLDNKSKRAFLITAAVLHFFILLIIGNELADAPAGNWDEGFCFYNAQNLAYGIPLTDYLIAYPAAIGTFLVDYLVICIGKLLGYTETMQFARVCILFSVLSIEGTIWCCMSSVKKLCAEKRLRKDKILHADNDCYIEFIAVIISYLFIPYYFYSLLYYSDTYSLLFTALLIKLYTDYCLLPKEKTAGHRKYIYMVGITLTAFAGAKIKATVAIVLMAILLTELIRKNFKFVLISITSYLVLSFAFAGFLNAVNDDIPTKENGISYKYPYTLYLRFGSEGDYGDYSYDIYMDMIRSANEVGIEQTKKNQVQEILNIISSRTLGESIRFYMGKANRLWGDGSYLFDLEVIPQRSDYNDCYLKNIFLQNGFVQESLFYVSQALQYIFAFLVLLGTFYLFKQSDPERVYSMVILALIGVTAFLVLIWENRSRYLFNMFPLICVSSAVMLDTLSDKMQTIHVTRCKRK